MTDSLRVVPLPVFNGTKKSYAGWTRLFKAYSQLHKFSEALSKQDDMPESAGEVIDEKTPEGLKKAIAKERNTRAMTALTFALQEDDSVLLLDGAMTTKWPDGEAHLIMKAIEREYRPKNLMQAVSLRRELNGIKMKKGEAPTQMFKELKGIKARYSKLGVTVSDEDLMATAVMAATKDYKGVLAAEQRRKGDDCTLDDLCECMEDLWSSTDEGQQQDDEGETKEVALYMEEGEFRGKCFKCNKSGHKKSQCPTINNGKGQLPVCGFCAMPGHKEEDCWLLEKNRAKRPEYFQLKIAKYDTAAAIIESGAASDDDKEMFL
jgi:gag-polypeptide of LTR copia-type